jgi:hypothetical protein
MSTRNNNFSNRDQKGVIYFQSKNGNNKNNNPESNQSNSESSSSSFITQINILFICLGTVFGLIFMGIVWKNRRTIIENVDRRIQRMKFSIVSRV